MSLLNLLERYTSDNRSVVFRFLDKLAKVTRKTGKISDSRKEKIVASFEAYDVDVVISSLNIYLNIDIASAKNGKGKNEKYVLGIMKNKQGEKDLKVGCVYGSNKGYIAEDEGARLQQLARSAAGGKLECDF